MVRVEAGANYRITKIFLITPAYGTPIYFSMILICRGVKNLLSVVQPISSSSCLRAGLLLICLVKFLRACVFEQYGKYNNAR